MGYKRLQYKDGISPVATGGLGAGLVAHISPQFVAADANQTITVAQMAAGAVQFTGFTAGRNLTVPTAAVLGAAFPEMDIGDSLTFLVSIVPAFAGTWQAAAGVTLRGRATTPASSYSVVLCVKTGAATYDWVVL